MRRVIQLLSLPILAAATLAIASPASADSQGSAGKVLEVTVNESSNSDYAEFHGKIVILENGTKTERTYHWGGSKCAGRNLGDASVDRLLFAFETRPTTRIVPGYKAGSGGARCLTGVTFVGKKRSGDKGPTEPGPV